MKVKEPQIGGIAQSTCGRDKGCFYVICRLDGKFVYVADGASKTLAEPKRKNVKHLRLLPFNAEEAGIKYPWDKAFDVNAAHYLKKFKLQSAENKSEE